MTLDLDPGTAALGNPRLIDAIVAEMDGGAIPFERFMQMALYHPEHGYYRKPGRVGPHGDFITSPTVHPMFAWVVAAWCRDIWQRLGRPAPFTIVEPGAGEGALARAFLDWAAGRDDGFVEAVRYIAVESGARGTDDRVEWRADLPEPFEAGVVVSNELFDALPVRLFAPSERGPSEVYVRWHEGGFQEVGGPIVLIDEAPFGARFELNQYLEPSAAALARLVGRGAVLTFDYGYPREELWAPWRKQGTLLCFYRHTAHEDPYQHVGEQDLTAHVDFTLLEETLLEQGMATFGPVSQMEFLTAIGVHAIIEEARADMSEYFARRRAVQQLTDGAELGRIRVLAATRGVPGTPAGFEEEA